MRPVGLVRSAWPHSVQGSSIHRKAIRLWIISVESLGFRFRSFVFVSVLFFLFCSCPFRPTLSAEIHDFIGQIVFQVRHRLSVGCQVLSHDTSETEHGQVHGDEYDGHEQADQQDQHGFEQVPQRAEAVLELCGQYVAFSGEHFG